MGITILGQAPFPTRIILLRWEHVPNSVGHRIRRPLTSKKPRVSAASREHVATVSHSGRREIGIPTSVATFRRVQMVVAGWIALSAGAPAGHSRPMTDVRWSAVTSIGLSRTVPIRSMGCRGASQAGACRSTISPVCASPRDRAARSRTRPIASSRDARSNVNAARAAWAKLADCSQPCARFSLSALWAFHSAALHATTQPPSRRREPYTLRGSDRSACSSHRCCMLLRGACTPQMQHSFLCSLSFSG